MAFVDNKYGDKVMGTTHGKYKIFSHSLGNTHIYQQLQVYATDTKCRSNKGLLINEIKCYEAK